MNRSDLPAGMTSGLALVGWGGGGGSDGGNVPPLQLERVVEGRAVVKLASGRAGLVALDEQLVSLAEFGPKRTLMVTTDDGQALRRIDATPDLSLADFSLHASSDITAVLTRQSILMRQLRRVLLKFALPLVALLVGCSAMDIGAVSRGTLAAAPSVEHAVMVGRIRFVVDGQPMHYGLLNKPALQLFHRGRGVLMSTPEAGSDGRFVWQLPAGDYGVAVIHGGKGPAGQLHRKPNGVLASVNGIVDPGLEFRLQPGGRHYVGTLEIHVQSMSQREKGMILDFGERVFGRLLDVLVVNEQAADDPTPGRALTPAPMRVIATQPR